MKKIIAIALAAVMIFALAACGSSEAPAASTQTPAATTQAQAPAQTQQAAAPAKTVDFPKKGISVICPWGAGGGTDACLRAFCDAMGKELGVTLTVDNLTGGGGIIGHQAIADADPDGYTFGMVTFELSTYNPMGSSTLTAADYDLLCRVNSDPAAITVNAEWAAANGITDLKTFVDYCKAHPGEVMMGGSSNASVWHVAGGYFMQNTGTEFQMITYQEGAAMAVQNAAGGFIQGVTVSPAEARSFIESGDLICLGILANERTNIFPDVPTAIEQGYDVTYSVWRGLAVPKGIDPEILQILRDACAKAIEAPAFIEYMDNAGLGIAYMPADEYASFLESNAKEVEESLKVLGLI